MTHLKERAPDTTAHRVPSSNQIHRHARILVVDDNPTNVSLITQMLARGGYEVVRATTSSAEAMGLLASFEPDLLLVDLHMPDPDGFAVIAELNEISAADEYIPVLALTADVTDHTKERALARGAHDFLAKPFKYTEMLLRIGNLLQTRMLYTELQRHTSVIASELDEVRSVERAELDRVRDTTGLVQSVLTEGGLTMVFQPVVDLHDGRAVGAEALARFTGPPSQTPDVWFGQAAEVGLGIELEVHAIRLALDELAGLPDDAFLSVNASAGTVCSQAFADLLGHAPADRLVLELTEHEQIADYESLTTVFRSLRDKGVRVAVDDAGSGYASLTHILRLGPDFIKLDRAMITALDLDPARRSLVSSLVLFAAETGARIIAEGIETTEELSALQALGVTFGQGYLLARPAALPLSVRPFADL